MGKSLLEDGIKVYVETCIESNSFPVRTNKRVHCWPVSEMPFKIHSAGGPTVARDCILADFMLVRQYSYRESCENV